MKLTKSVVDRAAPPASGQTFIRDSVLQGFALRITASGAKSFVVEVRVDGRVRRKTLGRYGALTVEAARRQAQQFLGKVATGVDPVAEAQVERARQITLAEVFEDYVATRKGLRPSTLFDYRRQLRKAFSDWQNRPLASISKDAVARRHARLGEKSPAQANNAMRVLRALFNFAAGQYEDSEGRSLFPENPVNRLSHTRAWYPDKRRRTWITPTQLPAWFAAVETLRAESADFYDRSVGDLLLLLLFTGLRRSEGLQLRWDWIDLDGGILTIPDTKNHEPLRLPLSDFLAELLADRRERVTGPYVFPGTGEAGHLIEPRPQMRKVVEASEVPFTLHDLRRTFITIGESLDIPVYAIKALVNHKMHNDVTAGYVVINAERLREPMQRITNHLLDVAHGRKGALLPFERPGRAEVESGTPTRG